MKYSIKPIDYKSIKEMPVEQRPREKVASYGPFYLSDLELVCCLLGSGNGIRPVQDIAYDIVEVIDRNVNKNHLREELMQITGLGEAKTSVILASIELGRRLCRNRNKKYGSPEEIFNYIRHYGDRNQEHFICVLLNGAMEIITAEVITVGLINSAPVHPREVFAPCIVNRATSVVLAHNHPSGNLDFSPEDLSLTQRLIQAGNLLGIRVSDHIVFSFDNYHSMLEDNVLPFT